MIQYRTGDMFLSEADCLINTVNCEGYMGKGIAYQFKMKFPENNRDYVKACKSGLLHVGTLHFYREDNITIINFPTKNKWREKSKMSYIETGLDEMIKLLPKLSVKSIAIPPLGCGNGGLIWADVRDVIEKKLAKVEDRYTFLIYEPSKNFPQVAKEVPKLTPSSLILMQMRMGLNSFSKVRLQKTAYFMNIFLGEQYFKFEKNMYGPYSHSIDLICKSIREYQKYYSLKDTENTYEMVYNVICSEKTIQKMEKTHLAIKKAVALANRIEKDAELEGIATALFIVERSNGVSSEDVVSGFKTWSTDKAKRFSGDEIEKYLSRLEEERLVEKDILGNYHIIGSI